MTRSVGDIRRRTVPPTQLGGLPPLLARIYAARGVRGTDELDLSLKALHPPRLLHGVDRAVARLMQALQTDERILIVGDFDADGATSTALAVDALRACGARHVDYLVPNRFTYGYGLTPGIVALAQERRPDLIVTVDNGVSSVDGVAAANAAGIDVLVTDHHLPGSQLPDAAVILNPNLPQCPFPSKALAGVGVMFYLLMALRSHLREVDWFRSRGLPELHLGNYLDLVALGTVADVVPLDRNNRILVEAGLQRIRRGAARPGIAALLAVAGRDAGTCVTSDLGFAAGPRLNAAGRLDDMSRGIECLMCAEPQRARALALELDAMNRERQRIERDMEVQALQALAKFDALTDVPAALVMFEAGWHQGVVGILASRVKERYHRPVIAFARVGEGELKGSGRSVAGLHLRDLLDTVATQNPGLLDRFGGHAMAAGLSLAEDRLEDFERAFVAAVAQAAPDGLNAVTETDGGLQARELNLEVAGLLRYGGPWGQHFPEPTFDGVFTVVSQRIVGERHLKLVLRPEGTEQSVDAIAFGVDTERWPDPTAERVRVVYRLDLNQFRGETRLQLMVEQIDVP